MSLYESIKVNKIDKKKIIKNEAIPANNQYNVEAENDNEKKLDIVEKLANDFVEYLRKNEIFAELDDYSIAENQRTNDVYGVIDYSISWGDWKHDHIYSEDLAKEFFKEDLSISEDVTEEDGSDTYSATHEFSFNLAPYLGKEIKESDEEPIECEIQFDEDGRAYFIYNNEKEYLDEYMRDNAGGAIKTLTAFSAIRIVPSDNGETVFVQYLHESEDELNEAELKHKMYDECPEDVKVAIDNFLADKEYTKDDLDEVIYEETGDNNEYLGRIFIEIDGKRYKIDIDGNTIKSGNVITKEAENKVSEEDINKLMTFFDKDDETIKEDFNRWTAVRTTMDNIGDREFPQLDFMIKYNLTPEEKHNLAIKICDKIEKELNESDRQVATVNDIDKIVKMSNKELDDFDRNHSYENSDLAEYVRCRLLYAETGLAKHKECYEKALKSLKDNKLNESSTEERWNATELDREEFYALLKFNNPEEHANPSLQYIITRDGNEVYRFAMSGTNKKIKDTGAKIEFRNFLKSKNNEVKEAEEIIDINNLTKEQLWKLRKEIVLGSIYVDDYKNSFGIEPKAVQDFFDSFIEDSQVDDEGKPNNRKTEEYDNAEDLYNYYSSCEYPFGEIEITEAEEIKEDADKNAKYVKSTLNKIALDKISKAIVNIEDAVSLINDNDEAKNKIKSIVEELEDYLNLDDYGKPKA